VPAIRASTARIAFFLILVLDAPNRVSTAGISLGAMA
jgi:hypothetical protein